MSVWNKAISACRHNIPNKVTTECICAYTVHNKINGKKKKQKTKRQQQKVVSFWATISYTNSLNAPRHRFYKTLELY